jgi:hypothetical protein
LVGGRGSVADCYDAPSLRPFTRILTFGFCTWIAVLSFRGEAGKTWAVVFIVIAIAFNPFIPLRLSRFTWPYLDLGAAIVLGVHLFFVRQKLAY